MKKLGEEGQAITEYMVLLAIVVGAVFGVLRWIRSDAKIQEKLFASLTHSFVHVYQSGNQKARGPLDPEGATYHPRVTTGDNFRIFINPRKVGTSGP